MQYRLVALDLDGTLLNNQMQIQRETIDAINRVRRRGVEVMLATGRHHVAAYPYWDQLQLEVPAVCGNGAYVYDYQAGCALATKPITRSQSQQLLQIARKHRIYCMIYADDVMAYEVRSPHRNALMNWADNLHERVRPRFQKVERFEDLIDTADNIWKFDTAGNNQPAMRAFENEVHNTMELRCDWSSSTCMDVVQAGNSKGNCLIEWLLTQSIDPSEVIAFGDHLNDIAMLQMVGMGVAMGNADTAVKNVANWVTGDNNGTGIADALNQLVLKCT